MSDNRDPRLDGTFRARFRALACCLLAAAITGCASAPPLAPEATSLERCQEVFRRVDAAVAGAGVQDGLAARVAGFPYLRVNRFLASYADEDLTNAQFADWTSRMIELGRQGYEVELANLSASQADALELALWQIGSEFARGGPALADCTARLAGADTVDPVRRAALRLAARVPDEYETWQRAVGLYWLTRVPFAAGIRRWQQEVTDEFALPLEALPVRGELKTYAPPPGRPRLDTSAVETVLTRAASTALRIPDPRGEDLEDVFRTFAPEFVVDTVSEADVPGELGWREGDSPRIVSRLPVVYRRASHVRHGSRALLQLNYWLWFPERPAGPGWDLLGGHLDAVLWRVTLAPDGAPWLFDSIHACGCYHLFFPTDRAIPRPQPPSLDETAFAPQSLPRVAAGDHVALRLAAGTHYLQRIIVRPVPAPNAEEYVFAADDVLRSLPLPESGRRSLFRPDGIVPGTERAERYLFWPMGVPEPGAMRQWGRHATAFVGRRHFDDPRLLEGYFELKDSEKGTDRQDRRTRQEQ